MRFWTRLLLALMLSSTVWAQAPRYQKPFGVKVQGLRSQIEALQVQAELKAARNTRYCRGANIPVPKAEWKCEKPGPGVERCEREYRCARIRADLSRLTETRRLLKRAQELGQPTGESKIEFYPEPSLPLVAPLKKVEQRMAKGSDAQDSRERKVRPSEISKGRLPRRSGPAPQFKIKPPEKTKTSTELIEQSSKSRERLALEDEQDLESLMREAPLPEEDSQKDESSFLGLETFNLDWKKVSGSWVSSTNEFEESQSMINLAWTPEIALSPSWSVFGQLGGHSYTVLTQEGEESFFVIDTFAHLQYSFWENWQVWGGLGLQKWNSEEGTSLTGMALGVARKINWGYLERVYLQRVSLSGDPDVSVSVSELRLGVSLGF